MLTRHSSFAILVLTVVLAALCSLAGPPAADAADISFGYGGDGVWPQTATANSQRWFRSQVTWDNVIAEGEPAPNERIDGLYLSGVSYSGMPAAPSGRTYAQVLGGSPKGIWNVLELGEPQSYSLTITGTGGASLPQRVYYTGVTPPGGYAGWTLIINTPGPAQAHQYLVAAGGLDPQGRRYLDVDVTEDPHADGVCQTLTITALDPGNAAKFYYSTAVGNYAVFELNGRTLEFDSGAQAGATFEVESNALDGGGYYIVLSADLPADVLVGDQCHPYEDGSIVDTTSAGDLARHFGVAIDIPDESTADNPIRVLTIGPFSNYHSDYLVGRVWRTWPNPEPNFTFTLHWSTWNAEDDVYEAQDPIEIEATQRTVPLALSSYVGGSMWPSGELQAWYSGEGTGVDPLVTTRSAAGGPTDPDNGSSSDEYTFRIRYFSGLSDGAGAEWPEMPSQWWRHTDPNVEFGEDHNFVNFNSFAREIMLGNATNADAWVHGLKYVAGDDWLPAVMSWTYGPFDDPNRDMTGDVILLGGQEPEAILIVDGEYNKPHFMIQESGSTLRTGLVYKYTIRPTNYLQMLHNIFTLQFDTPYRDAWDVAYWTLSGEPTCNAYVSMRPGGHTYEFLTCRDWDPPVWGVGGTGFPGGFANAGPCALALRGQPGYRIEAAHVVNQAWYGNFAPQTSNAAPWSGPDVYVETAQIWHYDDDPGGYGYPYDSQDTTQYPKIDPVLTAYPYFEEGPLTAPGQGFPAPGYYLGALGPQAPGSDANPFNPLPSSLAPGGEPWGDLNGPWDTGLFGGYGGSQHTALRFTNEDTIWPNYVNIQEDIHPTIPFRGGKWKTDTTFVFRINYWQSDNLSPTSMQLWLRKTGEDGAPLGDWTRKAMGKVYLTDNTYTDGVLYYYEWDAADLPDGGGIGDYQYSFRASDGTHIAIYPNRPADDPGYIGVPPGDNDYYWFRVNTPPELSAQSITPLVATAAEPPQGDFRWDITYTDDDGEVRNAGRLGDRPFKSILWIDLFGDEEGQAEVVSVAGNVITYELDGGAGEPYADGSLVGFQVLMETGSAEGEHFDITANTVSGSQGTITCTGLSGVAATDQFDIVDWFVTEMDETNPADTNYRDGALYDIDTIRLGFQLTPGAHLYYYEFWDNWAYWIDWQQYFMTSDPDPIDQKVEGEMVRLPETGFFETPYTGPPLPHISGTVYDIDGTTPKEGVTLSLYQDPFVDPDDLLEEVVTGPDGTYESQGVPDGDYRVIPSYDTWGFIPPQADVTVAGADVTGVDFQLAPTYSLSGTVYDTDGTTPLEGVTVSLYQDPFADPDDLLEEVVTGPDGTYEFEGVADGDYRVIPSYDPWSFNPTQADVTVAGADVTGVDFDLVAGPYSISGTVTVTGGGDPEGFELSVGMRSDTTDAQGDYTIAGLPNGAYTVTPSAPAGKVYNFTPPTRDVTISGSSIPGQDFTATEPMYSISGTVSDYEANPLSGVDIDAVKVGEPSSTASTSSNPDGTYTLTGITAGDWAVSATDPGGDFAFVPGSETVTMVDTDITGVDFTGYEGMSHSYAAGMHLTGVPVYPIEGYAEDVFQTSNIWRWHTSGHIYIGTGHPDAQALLSVMPGRGFFVYYDEATVINVAGTAVPTGIPFTMSLGPAWNMMANPFTSNLFMANIQPTVGGTLLPFAYVYDALTGSYLLITDRAGVNVARSFIEPREGAWVYAATTTTATIQMTASVWSAQDETAPQSLDVGESGWVMPVLARVGDRSDLTGAVGVTSEVEPYSLPNPPAAPGSVDLYFVAEDGSQLAQSITTASDDSVSWKFVVSTDIPDSDVEVVLPDLSQVPNDCSVMLVDRDAERTVYARTSPSYTFRSGEQGALRHFELQVMPRHAGGLVITTAAAQPGGAGAVVTYGISQPAAVSVEVMNISGRVIKRLASSQIMTAGTHTQSWNLRSDNGTVVPRGLYLVKVEAIADSGQRTSRLCPLSISR